MGGIEVNTIRRERLQRATMKILTNLAETDNLPWAVQVSLLTIIDATEIQAGAIKLDGGDDYIFVGGGRSGGGEKALNPDCNFDRKLKLFTVTEGGRALPCMFSDELARSGTLFCTRLSRWYGANRTSIPGGRCRKCQEFGYETVVAVPVKTAGKILGLIHLYDPREKALSADDLLFLETVSSPLGYALKHLQDRETIRESEEKLKSSYEKLRVFSSMVLKVQEEEKKRLSRELHDEIGQALTAVKIDLQVIKKELGKRDQGFQERLTDSIGLVDSTLEQVRKQVVSLRPPGLDHMGLVAAVQNMVRGFSRRTGIKARIIAGDKIGRFSSEVETALFRCIQESLTNIARHAGAKEVIIEFKYSPEYLSVSIKDDGKGFEPAIIPATPSSFGLAGMRERVELLNGKFKVDSEPKQGTRITVAIPLPRKGGG